MNTRVIQMQEDQIDQDLLADAGQVIQQGGIVAFPTETVYGLGGDAMKEASAAKIYAAKGRPSDNPLIVHISCPEDMKQVAREVPESAFLLAEAFWPGPLTMILPKAERVPLATTGGLDTVAVRMPDHAVALALIREAGGFVAAPSANLSGRPSPTLAKYVIEDMDGRIDMIIDGGDVGLGLESTIVDLTGETPMILRPGYITAGMLEAVLGKVSMDQTLFCGDCDTAPRAPGMKYRHYAPRGELRILCGSREQVTAEINRRVTEQTARGEKVGVIAAAETAGYYQAASVKSAGSRQDEAGMAQALYRILREFDEEQVTVIYSEELAGEDTAGGLGAAIRNRLLKAAGYCVEYITG